MSEHRWIFVLKTLRKPGALNSITGVFSSWGIALETAMLNATGIDDADGIVILSFACSPRKMEILERTVSRLSRVLELKSYPYETDKLRMIASFCYMEEEPLPADERVEVEEVIRRDKRTGYFITGTVKDVQHYLSPLIKRRALTELITTILTT